MANLLSLIAMSMRENKFNKKGLAYVNRLQLMTKTKRDISKRIR